MAFLPPMPTLLTDSSPWTRKGPSMCANTTAMARPSVRLDVLSLTLSYIDLKSRDGRCLLLCTEFHGQPESQVATTIAHRTNHDHP